MATDTAAAGGNIMDRQIAGLPMPVVLAAGALGAYEIYKWYKSKSSSSSTDTTASSGDDDEGATGSAGTTGVGSNTHHLPGAAPAGDETDAEAAATEAGQRKSNSAFQESDVNQAKEIKTLQSDVAASKKAPAKPKTSDPTGKGKTTKSTPAKSTGKKVVEQPKSAKASNTKPVSTPADVHTSTPSAPHTSTVPAKER